MQDEVRAAVDRLRRINSGEADHVVYKGTALTGYEIEQEIEYDRYVLAEEFLRTHRSDDAEFIHYPRDPWPVANGWQYREDSYRSWFCYLVHMAHGSPVYLNAYENMDTGDSEIWFTMENRTFLMIPVNDGGDARHTRGLFRRLQELFPPCSTAPPDAMALPTTDIVTAADRCRDLFTATKVDFANASTDYVRDLFVLAKEYFESFTREPPSVTSPSTIDPESAATYRLVLPFLDDTPAFAYGVEIGQLYEKMKVRYIIDDTFLTANQDQITLMFSRLGWTIWTMAVVPDYPEWFTVRAVKSQGETDAPGS